MTPVIGENPHVLLVDRFPIVRWGMRKAIELAGIHPSSTHEAGSLDEALSATATTTPGLAVVGGVDDADTAAVAQLLRRLGTRVVALLSEMDWPAALAFLEAGGEGCALDTESIESVADVVWCVAQGHEAVSAGVRRLVLDSDGASGSDSAWRGRIARSGPVLQPTGVLVTKTAYGTKEIEKHEMVQ